MLGGAAERQYRRLRPEVERMPWGTLDPSRHPPSLVQAARRSWTLAAFQEHRTGAACAATLQALIAARAPVDLVAMATRFPLDELTHVEMCARLAAELGGGTPLLHEPNVMVPVPSLERTPLERAAELVVRVFCVGEAVSIPLLRGTARAATHPLIRAVMGRIVKDEAAHGVFGFTVLDWALERLTDSDKQHLGRMADIAIDFLEQQWLDLAQRPRSSPHDGDVLGWMQTEPYLQAAHAALARDVTRPLLARGIPLRPRQL